MKKVYNLIIAVLIVALIVVIAMIVIRYGGNYLNEKEVSASLETIEEELNKEETQQSESLPELEFKGYKVEGIIEIPKINIKYTIYSTLSDEQLKISPCKFYGSNPLYNGNICIAGHNYNNSIFFSNIDKLDANDEICIYYMNIKFIYYVTNKYEVNENDLSPIYNYDRNSKELTLVSCNNLNKNRIIIKAKQK